MLRVAFVLAQALVLFIGIAVTPAVAADAEVTIVPPVRERVVVAPPPVRLRGESPKEYRHAFGCKRVWRCDAQVCEWRRGCWGVYGYMEGPYYSIALAKRQWERDGWPAQDGPRR